MRKPVKIHGITSLSSLSSPFLKLHLTNPSWDVLDPQNAANGLGVTHTAEAISIWGTSSAPDSANIPYIQGYWTSFIRYHDPNPGRYNGAIEWTNWDNVQQLQIKFENDPRNNTMVTVDEGQKTRCAAVSTIGHSILQ